jgi:hypothetical protein
MHAYLYQPLTHTSTNIYTHTLLKNSPIYITFMQIAQMIVGVIISVFGFIYSSKDPASCAVDPYVLKVSSVIYASYLYLFMEFMIKRFFLNSGKPAAAGAGAKKAVKKDL